MRIKYPNIIQMVNWNLKLKVEWEKCMTNPAS